MVLILKGISNQLRNISDSFIEPDEGPAIAPTIAIIFLTMSLSLVLLTSAQALQLKRWILDYVGSWETLQDPEE